ncbi:PTS lactose/cellobiose transporter subunit IIA [Anaerorhabdus furcosa]|uniref:PTS system, cellobiose-specific IIA component n=1 Tax=Anaerorhabdus furcosa TaxID=118967 RepID=A0A1T4NBP5_9FIRM|nr:PTS lactose/cellobiose transporter subunit IIA [Anaerorhabdus furcosa]SJZ76664.1 PTS system, cellobiose-specific IIA component [Anaerorhabdus furcosa]
MRNKSQYESICFEIISAAGSAKSSYLEAIEAAKEGNSFEELIHEGNITFTNAARSHAKALQLEAEEQLDFGLLLIHAETILSSAETIKDLSMTMIELINK